MPKGNKLTPKEELFCQLYTKDRGCFGNAVRSYMIAYNVSQKRYDSARTLANKLFAKAGIRSRIDQLMNLVIDDAIVDTELAYVIKQTDELPAKVAAIREYNRVKKRVEEPHQNTIFILNPDRERELNEALNKNLDDKEVG